MAIRDRVTPALSLILLAVSLLGGASALYQDQVGLVDWSQSYVGHVTQVVFHPVARARTVFVASDHAVASVHSRSGKLSTHYVHASSVMCPCAHARAHSPRPV